MSETARLLRFPARRKARVLSVDDARLMASNYLSASRGDRTDELIDECLSEPDAFLAICMFLREQCDSNPSLVADESVALHCWLSGGNGLYGLFDEREYFLGEAALLAASAFRLLGKRDEAELWLDRAEAGFRHTVNTGPALANVAYARLTLYYDTAKYDRVLELLPSLVSSFEKLSMTREALKCQFLEAMALKNSGRRADSAKSLIAMLSRETLSLDSSLHGLVLVNLGEYRAADEEFEDAMDLFRTALPLLSQGKARFPVAHLRAAIGETLRRQGRLADAVTAYRASIADYAELGMATLVANLRVVLAETLLAADRPREAEWEILQALPTIEEQKMVPEGFAAVALLRESVKQRKADPNALRELREHLQKQN